jgi:hypothetical protein
MPVAKLVGYTMLVNVGLVAALGAIDSDEATPTIELAYVHEAEYPELPPEENLDDVEDSSTLLIAQHADPALVRAQAIEEARTGCLLGGPQADRLVGLFDESDIGSGFESGRVYGLEIETTPPRAVRLGRITSVGGLDRPTIRRYVNRHIDNIEACYERELLERPAIEGTIVVQFVISPTGSVKDSRGAGFDATVARCVGNVIGTIAFPRPREGIVQVNYPLIFRVQTKHTPRPRV